jgi:magnesium transporter
MNVGVPGQGSQAAFWVIVGVMLGVLVSMVWWFRRRGFL